MFAAIIPSHPDLRRASFFPVNFFFPSRPTEEVAKVVSPPLLMRSCFVRGRALAKCLIPLELLHSLVRLGLRAPKRSIQKAHRNASRSKHTTHSRSSRLHIYAEQATREDCSNHRSLGCRQMIEETGCSRTQTAPFARARMMRSVILDCAEGQVQRRVGTATHASIQQSSIQGC